MTGRDVLGEGLKDCLSSFSVFQGMFSGVFPGTCYNEGVEIGTMRCEYGS